MKDGAAFTAGSGRFAIPEKGLNAFSEDRFGLCLAFPDDGDIPAHLLKGPPVAFVPRDVVSEFLFPELDSRFR